MRWTPLRSTSAQNQNDNTYQSAIWKERRSFHFRSGPYLWEKGKVLHHAGAFLVEYSDSQQGHASAQILEGQVEAFAFGQWSEATNFCVHLHQPSPEINLGETLICCDGVHLVVNETNSRRTGMAKKTREIMLDSSGPVSWFLI